MYCLTTLLRFLELCVAYIASICFWYFEGYVLHVPPQSAFDILQLCVAYIASICFWEFWTYVLHILPQSDFVSCVAYIASICFWDFYICPVPRLLSFRLERMGVTCIQPSRSKSPECSMNWYCKCTEINRQRRHSKRGKHSLRPRPRRSFVWLAFHLVSLFGCVGRDMLLKTTNCFLPYRRRPAPHTFT